MSWFPLVPRPRPPGRPLEERIQETMATATALGQATGHGELTAAARVFNRAALIASDTGMHQQARHWCWHHAALYLDVLPVDAATARLALEPIVNLARLRIRAGQGMAAYQLLDTLHHGIHTGERVEVDERPLPLDQLTHTRADRAQIAQWLWTVRLGDGLRALTSAGAWEHAAIQAERHGGIGQRLLDGRQTALIAHCLHANTDEALAMLQASTTEQPWEQTVQSCLETLCRITGGLPTGPAVTQMVHHYRTLAPTDTPLLFRTRLGLAVLDLADNAGHPRPEHLLTQLVDEAAHAGDGYAARDIRTTHPALLTQHQTTLLDAIIAASGLHTNDALPPHLPQLTAALHEAEQTIRQLLAEHTRSAPGLTH